MRRRDLIRGGGLLIAAAVPTYAESASNPSSEPVVTISTRATMAETSLRPGSIVYLAEPGREGLFRCVGTPHPQGDRLQGITVPSATDNVHFARIWDQTSGRPEWFGARTNDWRFDCADAIEACFALCPITLLAQADYFIRRTLLLDRSWRTVRGVGGFATDQGRGSRIILQGQAPAIRNADIIQLGPRRQPGPRDDSFATEIHLAQCTLIRDGVAAPHPSGELRRYPAGLRASFVTRCSVSDVASLENSVGFYFGGTVYTRIDDCLAQRLGAGAGGGADLAAGFYLDGSPDIGMAGGNASLYLDRCLAVGQHPAHVRPTGLVAEGAFVDSFIDRFETARIDNGMRFSAKGATRPGQTIDLHIRNCVLDGCGGRGLDVDLGGMQGASIEIADPYVYAAGGGGAAGVAIHDGGGLVTVTGGQVHGDFREGSLMLNATRGVRVQGLKLHEGSHPVTVRDSGALQLEPQISNLTRRTGSFAVSAAGVYRAAIRPMVTGAPDRLAGGVALDAACNYCSIDRTAIDPGCFSEVTGARKLWFGGADATRGAASVAFARAGNVVSGASG